MHQSAWLLIALRLLCLIPWRKARNIICVISLLWGNFTAIAQVFFARYANIPFFNSLYVKVFNFTDESSSYASLLTMTQRYFLYMLSNIGIVILVIWMYRAFIKSSSSGLLIGSAGIKSENGIKISNGKLYLNRYLNIGEVVPEDYYDIVYYCFLSLCFMFGALPYRIIFSRIAIVIRVIAIVPMAILLNFYGKHEKYSKRHDLKLMILLACVIKFALMMWFFNRSMRFNPLGWFSF